MTKPSNVIFRICFIIIFATITFVFVRSLLDADSGVSAAVIGAISVIGMGIWSHYSTRILEINSRHFIEKKTAYLGFINIIFDLFDAQGEGKKIKQETLIKQLMKFKQELMVWGDQAVIEALQIYEYKSALSPKDNNATEQLLIADDLLRAIRKDLGHNDSQLMRGSLIGMLLISEDRDKLISNKK